MKWDENKSLKRTSCIHILSFQRTNKQGKQTKKNPECTKLNKGALTVYNPVLMQCWSFFLAVLAIVFISYAYTTVRSVIIWRSKRKVNQTVANCPENYQHAHLQQRLQRFGPKCTGAHGFKATNFIRGQPFDGIRVKQTHVLLNNLPYRNWFSTGCKNREWTMSCM